MSIRIAGLRPVTIMYSGEVEHRDFQRQFRQDRPGRRAVDDGGLRPGARGDAQLTSTPSAEGRSRPSSPGSTFRRATRWPSRNYQTLLDRDIPEIPLPDGAGSARIIAGSFGDAQGPAKTFTPINLWDVRLKAGNSTVFELPEGHMTAVFVLKGSVTVNGSTKVGTSEFVTFGREGAGIGINADRPTRPC